MTTAMDDTEASGEPEIDSCSTIDLLKPYVSEASLRRLRHNICTGKSPCLGVCSKKRPFISAELTDRDAPKKIKRKVCLQKLIYWAFEQRSFLEDRKESAKGSDCIERPCPEDTFSTGQYKILFQFTHFEKHIRISQRCPSTGRCAMATTGKKFYCINPIHLKVEGLVAFGTRSRSEIKKPTHGFDQGYHSRKMISDPISDITATIDRIVGSNDDVVGDNRSVDGPRLSYEDDPEQKSTSSRKNATIIEEEDDERPRTVLLRIRRTYDKRSPYEVTSTNVKRGMRF